MDGTLTDQQVAIANKITANQYDNVSTTNIITSRDKCVYINNDVLSEIELEKEKEGRSIIDIILEWLFTSYYEKKHDKRKKELLEKYHDILVALEPDKEIEINQKSEVQIISILDDEHFTTAILDNKHKALVLIDPNGQILETKKFKKCKDKKDVFCELFGEKQALQLMEMGYSLCDGNYLDTQNQNDKELNDKENKIFDHIAKTNENKNGNQTKNGACGAVCCMMVKNYLRQRKKQKKQDMQTIIDNTNKQSVSTTQTIGYELKLIKNWDKVLSLNDTRNKAQQKGNHL